MCGRFTLVTGPAGIQIAFPGVDVPDTLVPRYNIAPSQPVAVLRNTSANQVELLRWGLIPPWAKDPAIGNRLINARAETLAEKPAFRTALRRRRCLILADGFYEWRQEPPPDNRHKTPFYFRLKSGTPFAFAGLWEAWQGPEDQLWLSCTIVTTTPNTLLQTVHTRMPVMLQSRYYAQWLSPAEQDPASLVPLLEPYPAEEMEGYVVSTLVNDPKNDRPECIVPV